MTPSLFLLLSTLSVNFLIAASPSLPSKNPKSVSDLAIDFIDVGDPKNPEDPVNHYGAVAEKFQISKYDVTAAQYCVFLNKVAKNSLSIQNTTRYRIKTASKISTAKAFGKWYYKCFRRTPIILTQIFLYRVLKIIGSNISKPLKAKVLYVTVGGTNSISDLLVKKFSKHTEISTIIENWDNMSSKAVFDYPPLRIGVWGDQSINFGRHIHKIDSNKIIGRFTKLF